MLNKYKLGFINGHYFINGTTTLPSYSLEHYEEIQDLEGCSNMYEKRNEKYKNSSGVFIAAFQLFKLLMNNIDTLIIKMPLTDEILYTQFYDKVDECKTL